MNYTSSYSLRQPEGAEYYDVNDFNENAERIDAAMSGIQQNLNITNASLQEHVDDKSNPHEVTKAQIGLSNVENKSSETIRHELTYSDVIRALGFVPGNFTNINCGDSTLQGIRLNVARDTDTNWTTNNPTLNAGEFGYDTTNKILKIGDGTTAWNDLSGIGYDDVLEAAKAYADGLIDDLVGEAPEALNTIYALADAIEADNTIMDALNAAITNKADKTLATHSANGLMSKEDKAKLDAMSTSSANTQGFDFIQDCVEDDDNVYEPYSGIYSYNNPFVQYTEGEGSKLGVVGENLSVSVGTMTSQVEGDEIIRPAMKIGMTKDNVIEALGYTPAVSASDGTLDYNKLDNLPKINGITLTGDILAEDLGMPVYANATTEKAGLLSKQDKAKLDSIETNANKYTHPTGPGYRHIPVGGKANQYLGWVDSGNAAWMDLPEREGKTYTVEYDDRSENLFLKEHDETASTTKIPLTKIKLGNVQEARTGEFTINADTVGSVSYQEEQDLTAEEQAQARRNIGAGANAFSGHYDDLVGLPTLGDAAAKGVATSVGMNENLITSRGVYDHLTHENYAKQENTYTKSQVDTLVDQMVNLTDYYNKAAVNNLLDEKVSTSDVGTAAYKNSTNTITNSDSCPTSSAVKEYVDNAVGAIEMMQTDTNTTYTFRGGANKFTVTDSDGNSQDIEVVPSIKDNITGTGREHCVAVFKDGDEILAGPEFGNSTTTYLRNDGVWETPPIVNYRAGTGLQIGSGQIALDPNGVTAGTYGPGSDVIGNNGNVIKVPQITVDAYGRISEVQERTYTSKNTTYSNATTSSDGLMSAADKAKLDSLSSGSGSGEEEEEEISLNDLKDVSADGADDGYVLVYNADDGEWQVSETVSIANGGTGNIYGYIRTGKKENGLVGLGVTIEGIENEAGGDYAHAEGRKTSANGYCSHAEGYETVVYGGRAHVEGSNNIATYNYQHVQGKFNDNKSTTLFEIGNGTSNTERNNAFEVYNDGSISMDNGTSKFKFAKSGNEYGYYADGSNTFTAFGSGGSMGTAGAKNYTATISGSNDLPTDAAVKTFVEGKGYLTSSSLSGYVQGSGTSGYLAKFNGDSSVTSGPALGESTTTFLRNDGTWAVPAGTSYENATTSTAGLMSAEDKTKLNGIAAQANNYVHPTEAGYKHIPTGGQSGKILGWSASGEAAWVDPPQSGSTYTAGDGIDIENNEISIDIDVATKDKNGLMSAAHVQTLNHVIIPKVIDGTLQAGSTTLTLEDEVITTDSHFQVYTSAYGVVTENIEVTTGRAVLTYAAQQANMDVELWVFSRPQEDDEEEGT